MNGLKWDKLSLHTIAKKGDTRECKNNRTIASISHASKVSLYVLKERLRNISTENSETDRLDFVAAEEQEIRSATLDG